MPDDPVSEDATLYDAIVVGSGFGGAVAACRLAQAGFNVLILERGRRYGRRDFPGLPESPSLLPDFRRWAWTPDQGLWDVIDLEDVVSVQAAGYGGGSLIYGNVHMRPPAAVFGTWPDEYNGGRVLEDFYDLVAHMLEVAPVDSRPEFHRKITKADQFSQATIQLRRGATTFHPPLAIAYEDRINIHGVHQNACKACGACCTGCPEGAKNTLDHTYLAIAEKRKAHVRTECEVTDIVLHADGWQVEFMDHLTGRPDRFTGRNVFLCAGSVHSTRLLARAQLREKKTVAALGQLPIGKGYSPGAGALAVAFDTTHPQHPSAGPTITTSVVHWDENGSFFLVQDGGFPRQLERLAGLFRASAWVGRNRLSLPGHAKVRPSPQPAHVAPAGPPGLALPSLVDDMLVAISGGALQEVISARQRRHFRSFLDELKRALLLPEIVEQTITSAIIDRYQRCPLTTKWKPDRAPLKWLINLEKAAVRCLMGGFQRLATHALRAVLSFGGLSSAQVATRVLGYNDNNADRRIMMLAMGSDSAKGELFYESDSGRFVAELDLFQRASSYAREELLMTDIARMLGGELRTNPAWAFLGKPITAHNQGGAGMSDSPATGVTDPHGKVHGCTGLYVLDGSILPTSVGVNPSATIAAVAEYCILHFIRHKKPQWPKNDPSVGAREYDSHRAGAAEWRARADAQGWVLTPPRPPSHEPPIPFESETVGVRFHESLNGYYSFTEQHPKRRDAEYRRLETGGRPTQSVRLDLDVSCANLMAFMADPQHAMEVSGEIRTRLPNTQAESTYRVTGQARLLVAPIRRARYAPTAQRLANAAVGGPTPPPERFMEYDLWVDAHPHWFFSGYKRISDHPGFDAWRDTSSLFFTLALDPPPYEHRIGEQGGRIRAAGTVHVDLFDFLFEQVPSLTVTGTTDPSRITWATATFAGFFMGSLQRVYLPEIRPFLDTFFGVRAPTGPRPIDATNLKSPLTPPRQSP